MDPEASSPGFAFLLATIATYGDDGWQDYWQQLADGGVTVTSGWSDAYYGEFVAGGGDKAIVTSYATSPVAEMIFATTDIDEPPTGVVADSCFRQVEFAGVLAGTEHADAAGSVDRLHAVGDVPGRHTAQHVRVPGQLDRGGPALVRGMGDGCG